jgi:hypothetical protein
MSDNVDDEQTTDKRIPDRPPPWMAFNWEDFMIQAMPYLRKPEDIGIYITMMGLAWLRGDASIPGDMGELKHLLQRFRSDAAKKAAFQEGFMGKDERGRTKAERAFYQRQDNRRHIGHVYSHVDTKWDGLQLRLKSGWLLATVEADSKCPEMCRVRLPSGHLTDMVNLTRAKDAAISLALGELNKPKHEETASEASPVRPNLEAAE